jgi:hypothetical protein
MGGEEQVGCGLEILDYVEREERPTVLVYKLTDQKMRTRNEFQWVLGKEETARGNGLLCSPAWLHAYTDPLLAVLLNPIHADIVNPRLFVADGYVGATDNGLKVGCTRLVLTAEMPVPQLTTKQRVRFGILCAQAVCTDVKWNAWAADWLSGHDCSRKAAESAEAEAEVTSAAAWARVAAAWEAAATAATAAESAAWASSSSRSAATAATRAATESAAIAAATAATAAESAAWASSSSRSAATAATEAARAGTEGILDLITIAHKAIESE